MNLNNRYDFVLIFDVKDGNPNGDPDAGNMPRLDAESGHGLVTDVCLKRKVRNFVSIVKDQDQIQPKDGEKRFEIYVREKAVLNLQHERAYAALGIDTSGSIAESAPIQANIATDESPEAISETTDAKKKKPVKEKRKGSKDQVEDAKRWMCQNFFDVRTFGAVMSTGTNCGQVRGPVQLTFSRSVEPIISLEHSITRMSVTTEKEAAAQDGDNRTMGRKHTVPYGVYVAHGFISSFLAKQTGFDENDLTLLFQSFEQMFDHDRSAARGEMAARGLYVFKHESELGNAPAHALFDRLNVTCKDKTGVTRSFDGYEVTFDGKAVQIGEELQATQGVSLKRYV